MQEKQCLEKRKHSQTNKFSYFSPPALIPRGSSARDQSEIIITQGPSPSHLLEAAPSPSGRLHTDCGLIPGDEELPAPFTPGSFHPCPAQAPIRNSIESSPLASLLGREISLLSAHPSSYPQISAPRAGTRSFLGPSFQEQHGNFFSEAPGSSFSFLPGSRAGDATAPGGRDTTFHHLGFPPCPSCAPCPPSTNGVLLIKNTGWLQDAQQGGVVGFFLTAA